MRHFVADLCSGFCSFLQFLWSPAIVIKLFSPGFNGLIDRVIAISFNTMLRFANFYRICKFFEAKDMYIYLFISP